LFPFFSDFPDGDLFLMPTHRTSRPDFPHVHRWLRRLRFLVPVCVAVTLAVSGYVAFCRAPRVPDATFTLLSGQKISTGDLNTKVYLVHFWATSCPACISEMPQLVRLWQRWHGQGLEVVAVAMRYDNPEYVRNYAQTRHLPFMVAQDDGSVAQRFGDVQLTPTTFVINRAGRIEKRYAGEPSFFRLNAVVQAALNAHD
jgi:thiol-disulfide isomerase/thioredoxin